MMVIMRKNILLVILYLIVTQAVRIKEDALMGMPTKDFCDMSEFTDLDYYLFCDSMIHKEVSDFENKPVVICSETSDIDEAKEQYQKFKDQLPLDQEEQKETYLEYVSPDCKWVITTQWDGNRGLMETTRKQQLFYEKDKLKEAVSGEPDLYNSSFIVVKNGNSYTEMDPELYKKVVELNNEGYENGYYERLILNEEGTLAAGIVDSERELTIWNIKDDALLWKCPLDGMKGTGSIMKVMQFLGDEEEGDIIIQYGSSTFYKISYPSGKTDCLGESMYSVCYSPDGKYAAYSSMDHDSRMDVEPEEYNRYNGIQPGIYILEIETGKVAYLYWDPFKSGEGNYLESRSFLWIEKDAFDEYMKK